MEQVRELINTDPDDLLPEDRALLFENFEDLGSSSALNREYWIASMNSAIAARAHKRGADAILYPGDNRETQREFFATANPDPDIDTEGSIRFRKRRRKLTTP